MLPTLDRLASMVKRLEPPKVVLEALPGRVDTVVYRPVEIGLSIAYATEDTRAITHARIELTFLDQRGEELSPDHLNSLLDLRSTTLAAPALSPTTPSRAAKIAFRALRPGAYDLAIKLVSAEDDLLGSVHVPIHIAEMDLSPLVSAAPADAPAFVTANDGVVDVSPRTLAEFAEFKVLIANEVIATTLAKGTLWIRPTYLGSMGGPTFEIFRDTSRWYKAHDPFYLGRSSLHVATLEHAGFVDSEPVPVGRSFYRAHLLDTRRIRFTEAAVPCQGVLMQTQDTGRPSPILSLPPGTASLTTPKRVDLPEFARSVLVAHDCGVTGRNCVFELTLDERTFTHYTVSEFAEDQRNTDFPVVVSIPNRGFLIFSLDADAGRLTVRRCA